MTQCSFMAELSLQKTEKIVVWLSIVVYCWDSAYTCVNVVMLSCSCYFRVINHVTYGSGESLQTKLTAKQLQLKWMFFWVYIKVTITVAWNLYLNSIATTVTCLPRNQFKIIILFYLMWAHIRTQAVEQQGQHWRKQENYLFNNYKIVHITRSKYHWPIIWISRTLSARHIIAYFLSLKNGTFLFLRTARNYWLCFFSNVMNVQVHSHLFVSISMSLSVETGAFQEWKSTGVSFQWQNVLRYISFMFLCCFAVYY